MQILDLLGMYIDAVVVEVKTFLLLFRLPLAILWTVCDKSWVILLHWFKLVYRRLGRATCSVQCSVHSISAKSSQEKIECTKAKAQLRSYCLNMYTVTFVEVVASNLDFRSDHSWRTNGQN